jgi:thiol-disulfide isomerase/thioredoxin
MKKIFCFLLVLTIYGCKTKSNIVMINNEPIIVGILKKEDLQKEPFVNWYQKSQEEYTVNAENLKILKNYNKGFYVTIFMGTWCEDSHNNVPKFIKLAEAMEIPRNNIQIIGMDKTKKTPENQEKDQNITNVPTFIFSRNNKEFARITENPKVSLEADLIRFLVKK